MKGVSSYVLLCFTIAVSSAQYVGWKTPMSRHPVNGTSISSHIIAGSPAILGMFPWQASLLITKSSGTYRCGGTLIHPQWVLTAAHCTIGATSIQVYLGTLIYNSGTASIANNPNAILTHPSFNAANLNYDIALVKLPTPVALFSTINVIKIAPSSLQFSSLNVSGWGKTCDLCAASNTLNYATVNAITNIDCTAVYGTDIVTTNTVCTKGTPNQSTCQGDSGGPLVQTGTTPYLVGVVSFGSAAGCENEFNHPAGYIRATNFCSWIESYTGALCPTSNSGTTTTKATTTVRRTSTKTPRTTAIKTTTTATIKTTRPPKTRSG